MIIGDPFIFALEFQPIPEWNQKESSWINGIFSLYIGGVKLPGKLEVAELTTSLGTYAGLDFSGFNNYPTALDNDSLIKIARRYILQLDDTAPEDFKKTNAVDLTCTVMEDQGCYAFLFHRGAQEIFIWTQDNGLTMQDIVLSIGTVERVVSKCPVSFD